MDKKIKDGKTNLFNTKYELVLLRDEDTEAEIASDTIDQQHEVENPYTDDFNYENWWNRYRASWLKSEIMTDDEIKTRVDDAWEVSDYKEVINLMAEMICRLQKQ